MSPALNGHASPQEVRLALAVGEHRWAAEAAETMTALLEQGAGSPIQAFDALERALDRAASRNHRRPFIDSWNELRD